MSGNVHKIRNSAKAVIIERQLLLLIRYHANNDTWYTLPGGGQMFGETLSQALIRECLEETGYRVTPGRLLFMREYIGRHHQFAHKDGHVHQMEFMFAASLAGEPRLAPSHPDGNQTGCCWIDLALLPDVPLFPAVLRTQLSAGLNDDGTSVYLGDVN